MVEQIANPEKGFLIAAICVYIASFGMSMVGHYPKCGKTGSLEGGLWKVCNTLGCVFIGSQAVVNQEIMGMPPDYEDENSTYIERSPNDYMLHKMARFALLSSQLLGFGIILTLGFRIGLIFTGTISLMLLISQSVCHYLTALMAAIVFSVLFVSLFDEVQFVVYLVISSYVITNVAIFLAFGHLITKHLQKHKILRKKK